MEEDVKEETQEKETQPEAEETVEKTEEKEKSLAEELREEREKLEKERKKVKAENDRTEILKAKEALGGRAEAGGEAEKKEPLSDREYAEKFRRGEIDMSEVLPK